MLFENYYSTLLENIILPVGDLYFKQNLMKRIKFIRNAQWWSREKIDEYQRKALIKLVNVSFTEVPFYHDYYASQNVSPDEIRSVQDISKLPITNKKTFRDAGLGKTVRNTKLKTYLASTSGSTGENFIVIEDTATAGFYRASFMLSLEWAGYRIGQRHMQTGMTLNRSSERKVKDFFLRCHYESAFNLDNKNLNRILDLIDRKKIKHLWGYPGSIYYLAKRAEELGANLSLKSIVTWGDLLVKSYRKKIENIFSVKVYDTYGCAEGIQIAAQCGHGYHYHVHELDTIVELLDDSGNPVGIGETGNVVVTRLYPGPMPLIRYSIGDKATWSTSNSCECGRKLKLLDHIDGRQADEIITPSGNRLILHFFTGILEFFPEIESFQVIQEEKSSITLNLVPRAGYSINKEKIIDSLQKRGADLHILINIVDSIPLEKTGKRKFILNKK